MFERLGSWTYRFRFVILVLWIVGAAFFGKFAPSLAGQGSTDQTTFLPANAPSAQAKAAIERAFPGSTSTSSATITMDRPTGLTDADRAWRDEFTAWVVSDRAPAELRAAATDTATADSRPELEELFRATDGTFELFVVNLNVADAGDAAAAVVGQLRDQLAATVPAGLETHVTGAAAISSDYLEAVRVGTDSTTTVTIVLVLLVLLAIYRAPLAALVPLATIGVAYVVSKGILGFMAAAGFQVSSTLATFLVVMVFGIGTDYAIFLISRYREEVSHDGDWHDAAKVTVKRIGAVITASAGTVIVGMLAMGAGDFKMIASMGPGIAIAVAVTLVAALTLSPALLSIFGHYLFWPLHTREKAEGEPRGFFASLANAVSRRPGFVTVALLALLALPILYLPQVKSNFDVLADLPKTADSRIGYQQIGDHLGEDKLVQSTGLIALGGDGDILAPAKLARLHELMVDLQAGGGIATTTSLVTPDGNTTTPDGFRPSKNLQTIADGFKGDTGSSSQGTDNASLLDPKVRDGLNQALDYVNGVGVAFPDVAAGTAMREAKAGLAHALNIVDRVGKQSVLTTQLRTLSASITDPANAASSSSGGSDSTLMSDYLAELAAAYPEVTSLDAYRDAVKAAASLEKDASVAAALDLSDAFGRLADHFDAQPAATLSPKSLSGTAAAKELKKEAEDTFNALPDQFGALATIFAARSDDYYVPTTLTGDDGKKLQDAIDAFVSKDHTATRFYLTSSNAPYSGDAFGIVRQARTVMTAAGPSFGPTAQGHIGGPTAQFADVNDTLNRDFLKVGVITVLGILVVLMLLLRAIVAPLYLVGTVLVSYGSTIGVSAFLFQDILGHPGISPYLPLMVFVLLVALGSDYNIFLMHRVREEAETRSMRDAVRIASGHTGAVITSAGVILAGTFGSMATAPLTILLQVGVAVAIGVLIDTFLVRSILVPAITSLVGDLAWWPSGAAFTARFGKAPLVPAGAGAAVPVGAGAVAGRVTMAEGAAPAGPVAAPFVARTTRRRLAMALALVILIPVTVAGLLTWSLGSSTGNLRSVRAAVVNLDQGGSVPAADGTIETLALGTDLATALQAGADGGFTWVETSDDGEAKAGLADGRYAAVLTIPADFSRIVAAIRTDTTGSTPKATLGLATNDGSGYALGVVARQVATAISTTTAQGVTASYVDGVLLAVSSAHDALSAAATDATSVSTSTTKLADAAAGAGTFADQLVSGLQTFIDQAGSASDGTAQLVDGTRKLADGSTKLAAGAKSLASGATAAADGAAKLSDGAATLSGGLATLKAQTSTLPKDTALLAQGTDGIAAMADPLATGTAGIATGLDAMATGATRSVTGLQQLDGFAAKVENDAQDAITGATSAANAAGNLAGDAGAVAGSAGNLSADLATLAADCAASGASGVFCTSLDALVATAGTLAGSAGDVATAAGQHATRSGDVAAATGLVHGEAEQLHTTISRMASEAPGQAADIATLATSAQQLAGLAAQLQGTAASVKPGMRLLADGMPALSGGIAKVASGGADLASGARDMAAGLDTLATGTSALASGAQKSASGAQALADGTAEAGNGIADLTTTMQTAVDAGTLVQAQAKGLADDGTALADQADALAKRLETSATDTATYPAETRTKIGTLAADPVAVEASRVNAVTGAESGLAPFLMAIAAWLGALAALLVLPAVWRSDDPRWWRSVLVAFGMAAGIAVAGALLMVLGLRFLVGISVADLPALLGFAVLAALAFTAIVQALVALFGNRGWLVSLLILVLGIAASGVPLSAAAAPGPLAALGALLPLTYAIDAFRSAIAGGGSAPLLDAIVLAGWLAVGVLVTLAAAAGIRRRGSEGG